MTVTLDKIYEEVLKLKTELENQLAQRRISATQVQVSEGLSDISERLGLIQAGEFRAGNGVEPTKGFSGVRIGYPSFTYNGNTYNIVGVRNDKLQIGISADDGSMLAAGGNIIMDAKGIHSPTRQILFRMSPTSGDTLYAYGGLWGNTQYNSQARFGIFNAQIGSIDFADDFEDGTTDAWTVTGTPTVATDSPQDLYSVEVDNSNYITKTLTTVANNQYAILLYAKQAETGSHTPVITVEGVDNYLEATDAWGQLIVTFYATDTSTIITFKSSSALNIRYDDIQIYNVGAYTVVGSQLDGESTLSLEASAGIALESPNVDINCVTPGHFTTDCGISFWETSSTPSTPNQSIRSNIYLKGDKLIIQFNDGGTVRYKYLDLTGTGVTWVHTTSAP